MGYVDILLYTTDTPQYSVLSIAEMASKLQQYHFGDSMYFDGGAPCSSEHHSSIHNLIR
mgnify:FL=1